MGSTIQENATLMKELLDVEPRAFMPSIPRSCTSTTCCLVRIEAPRGEESGNTGL